MFVKHKAKLVLFFLWFFGTTSFVFCQENAFQFHRLTVDEGLAHTDATCIRQDGYGFTWIGTYSGLNRYDGYELKTYPNHTQPIRNVYNNRITDLYIDQSNRIWLATQGGLGCFDLTTETFLPLKSDSQAAIQQNLDLVFFDDERKHIYAAGTSGLAIFQYVTRGELKKTVPVTGKEHLSGVFHSIQKGPDGNIWIGKDNGLYVIHLSSKGIHITPINLVDETGRKWDSSILDLLITSKGEFVAGMVGGIFKAQPHQKKASYLQGVFIPVVSTEVNPNLSLPDDNTLAILKIKEDGHGRFWLGTISGLIQLQIQDGQKKLTGFLKSEPLTKYNLTSNHISDLYIDNGNIIWICTFGGGVNYANLGRNEFQLLQRNPLQPGNTLSGNYIRALLSDNKGNLWIGTRDDGLDVYDFSLRRYTHYKHRVPDPGSLSSNNIRAITQDKQGRIWVGTTAGINILDPGQSDFAHLIQQPNAPNSISSNVIFSLAVDLFGQVWAGSWDMGLNRIQYTSPQQYTVERIYHQKSPGHMGLSSNKTTFIYADPDRPELFVGTDQGLNHLFLNPDGSIRKILHYQGKDQTPGLLSSNFIWPIVRTSQNTLYVGTLGGGLNKVTLDPRKESGYFAEAFRVADGAPSDDIESILVDRNGDLWLGSRGLSQFNPKTKKITNFDVNDGLQSNSFKIGAAAKGNNGILYFGGTNGINYFLPDSIKPSLQKPHIALTDLIVNGVIVKPGEKIAEKIILDQSLNTVKKLRITNEVKSFSISFTALNYGNPTKCQYRYRLEGVNKDWIVTDAQNRRATFANLDYGEYTFKVMAANRDGIWGNEQKSILIEVIAPWYATQLAKVFYWLIGLGILAGIYYYIIHWNKLKRAYEITLLEERKMEEMYQLRMQFFTNISHEFRTPLALILNPLERLMNGSAGPRKTQRYYHLIFTNAKRLLDLVNELMDFRKAESGAYPLRISLFNLKTFAEEIAQAFQETAQIKGIRFCFEPLGNDFQIWADKKALEKVLMNLMSNAIKYTKPSGAIKLELFDHLPESSPAFVHSFAIRSEIRAKDYLWIKVTDTGLGVSEDALHLIFDRYFQASNTSQDIPMGSGVGLALVRSLVLLHQGDIQVSSEEGKGTEFILSFPKGNLHFKPEVLIEKAPEQDLSPIPAIEIDEPADGLSQVEETQTFFKPKVLLVEDNTEFRSFLKENLEDQFAVLEAQNGKTGFQIVLEHHPDVIVSDIMMPVMDGVTFCKAVKANPEFSHIPFILLTAKSSLENQIEGVESGADIYFSKPLSIRVLQLTIQNLLKSRKLIKDLYLNNAFAEAREVAVNEKEKSFMEAFMEVLESRIEDPEFDIEQLCKQVGMSRTKLYGKIKALTGKPIGDFIRSLRLKKAAQILASEDISVVQAMYRVGIQSQSYFTKSFKKEFGKTPARFVQELSHKSKTPDL